MRMKHIKRRFLPHRCTAAARYRTLIDSMTMSAPSPEETLVVPTNQGPGERSRTMIIIGADYHPGFQQIAFVDTDTGEIQEGRLVHRAEAETFYRDLGAGGKGSRGDGGEWTCAL